MFYYVAKQPYFDHNTNNCNDLNSNRLRTPTHIFVGRLNDIFLYVIWIPCFSIIKNAGTQKINIILSFTHKHFIAFAFYGYARNAEGPIFSVRIRITHAK